MKLLLKEQRKILESSIMPTSLRKMNRNLVWGAGYNFIAIPQAVGILAPIGVSLTSAVGAILMSFSTIIVAVNAMFLNLDSIK